MFVYLLIFGAATVERPASECEVPRPGTVQHCIIPKTYGDFLLIWASCALDYVDDNALLTTESADILASAAFGHCGSKYVDAQRSLDASYPGETAANTEAMDRAERILRSKLLARILDLRARASTTPM